MRQHFVLFLLLFFTVSCTATTPTEDPVVSYALCNPKATAETQQLWSMLCAQYGRNAISGVVANIDWNTREGGHLS